MYNSSLRCENSLLASSDSFTSHASQCSASIKHLTAAPLATELTCWPPSENLTASALLLDVTLLMSFIPISKYDRRRR